MQAFVACADVSNTCGCTQVYWIDGLGSTAESVLAAAEAGLPLRGALWVAAHPALVPPPGDAGAASEPAAPAQPPELWSALREAAVNAGWESVAGQLVALKLQVRAQAGATVGTHAVLM
jgi:hypothetical protein